MHTTNPITWPNHLLEPVLVTYNRAPLLEKTLQAFVQAGLIEMRMHVVDNASTDETSAVVSRIQKQWPNLQYHKNLYNISGNGNILRSVEFAHTPYHWVIGDDDQWLLKPSTLCELIQVLQKGEADIIRLGWLVSPNNRQTLQQGRQLALTEPMFFASVSMISATIIRRSIVAKYLPQAYQNTADSYPQLVAPIKAVEDMPVKVYSLSEDLMLHTPSKEPGYFCGDFEWCAGWFRTSRFFTDPPLQKSFVTEVTYYMCREQPSKLRQFIATFKMLLYFKSFNLNQWPYLLSMLAYGKGWRLRVLILLFINACTPTFMLTLLRKGYFRAKGTRKDTIRFDRSRL